MKRLNVPFIAFLVFLTGCHSLQQEIRAISREYYNGNNSLVRRAWNGFSVNAPESWFLFIEIDFDGTATETGTRVAIRNYEWSPVLQFNRLNENVTWRQDLVRLDAELCKREDLVNARSEELNNYNKFDGHGLRTVGISRGRPAEHIIFYPDGEFSGTRLLVILYGSPNAISLREMESVIRSATYGPSRK